MISRCMIPIFAAMVLSLMPPVTANAGTEEVVYHSYARRCCGDPCSFWTRVRQAFDFGYPYDYCYDYDNPRPCPPGQWKP